MLPTSRRLHTERDILRLLRTGARKRDALLQLVAAPGQSTVSRAAVVVSKQVAKRATVRNTLRRRVQAALPKLLAATLKPTDVLIRLSPASAAVPAKALLTSLTNLWPIHGVPNSHSPQQRHRPYPAIPARPLTRP
ncbi:MAG: ribonuclease P protein component [bacterium]|nr:ribonuclease P protein component [bacterium]